MIGNVYFRISTDFAHSYSSNICSAPFQMTARPPLRYALLDIMSAIGSAEDRAPEQSWTANGMLTVYGVALASFVLHMIFNNRYGYFRDEFDYIVCGRHPAWGYVDQPPLLPILSRICLAMFGDSLRSVRLIPALSASALIVLTGVISPNSAASALRLRLAPWRS
jgi:hypothetical protein